MKINIYNEDCITGAKNIEDKSVDLIICDPPFGIDETGFGKHYNRKEGSIIEGYVEAPYDYDTFTFNWIQEAKRIMKDDGSMYIVSGWSNLSSIYKALDKLDLYTINHIIWKYNFGVATKSKFVSAHYHIFYISKNKKTKVKFNKNAYFSQVDKDISGRSLQYADMEDVWIINKEYQSSGMKNMNKLPSKLVEKIINYSSDKNDMVCDFFMGSFTTADCALRLGRNTCGFELNKNSYEYYFSKMCEIDFGIDYLEPKKDDHFPNQGKAITDKERLEIVTKFNFNKGTKKQRINELSIEFGRGYFSILNIINNETHN
jgi:site-specific DNA-methyltransferase (adenine-specific)